MNEHGIYITDNTNDNLTDKGILSTKGNQHFTKDNIIAQNGYYERTRA